ncbi:hypothetical protein [Massilia sp. TS11]|uniref:hypothetical protein n=1 Tax=Massilia sp. TS11 TaxID=2908003 RepID=UPI001EDC31B6|nr:hypothetical protein [Massilia sp. TS11]MCG2584759.1 hypothetical protein [Massilia sp. TS11]
MRSTHFLFAAVLAVCCGMAAAATTAELKSRQLADLDTLRSDYVQASMAFSDTSRAAALQAVEALRTRAGAMSEAEFTLALARVAALADNAHDEIVPNAKLMGPRLPVRLAWFGQELMVVLSAPDLPELAGATVLSLGGKKPEELAALTRPYIGGPDHFARANSTWLLESPALLGALGLTLERGKLGASFRLRDGTVVERQLAPLERSQVPTGSVPELLRSAGVSAASGAAWNRALLGAPIPLAMQEPEKIFRAIPLRAYDALYVQFRGNYDHEGGRTLGKFAGDTAALAAKLKPRFLVLDQRFNGGGNTDLTRELMKVLAENTREKVYILTSEYTFSAGIVSSAIAKQAAGPKVRVIGSLVGDRLRWWSENRKQCLPNSGHCFTPSYGLWDLRKGCAQEQGCFGDAYDVKINGLDPDMLVPLTAADWLAGYDAALMAAAADAAGGQR